MATTAESAFLKAGIDLIAALSKHFAKMRVAHRAELDKIGKIFGPTEELAKFYIEPRCQSLHPGDVESNDPALVPSSPIFGKVDAFLGRDLAIRDGSSNLFVLADAGMGKTSLLVMLKLMHLARFWPAGYNCRLLKIGPGTLDEIAAVEDPANTVLLLDSLDEDAGAHRRSGERLVELLSATRNFRRTIITCRTQYFPSMKADPIERKGQIVVGNYYCTAFYLSPFSDAEVDAYLQRRFRSSWLGWRAHPLQQRARELTALMKSLRCRPMLLAHIEEFANAEKSFQHEYEMYEVLVERWLDREVCKARERGTYLTTETLRAGAVVLALKGQQDDVQCFSPEQMEALGRVFDGVHQVNGLSHQFSGRSLLVRSDDGFRFAHRSFQEFLVAWCCLNKAHALVTFRPKMTALLLDFMLRGLQSQGRTFYFWLGLATNPTTPPSILEELAQHDSHFVRSAVIESRRIPARVDAAPAEEKVDWISRYIPEVGITVPPEGMDAYEPRARKTSPWWPSDAAGELALTRTIAILEMLSQDATAGARLPFRGPLGADGLAALGDRAFREALFNGVEGRLLRQAATAIDPGTSKTALASLVAETNPLVRAAVARNPSAPVEILQTLAADTDLVVRESLAFNHAVFMGCPALMSGGSCLETSRVGPTDAWSETGPRAPQGERG